MSRLQSPLFIASKLTSAHEFVSLNLNLQELVFVPQFHQFPITTANLFDFLFEFYGVFFDQIFLESEG
jgi:hypothetical protein